MADTAISAAVSGAPALLTDEFPIGRSPGPNKLTLGDVQTLFGAASAAARNLIINGNFVVNERVYVSSAVLASGSYGHDRWKAGASGGDYSFTQLPNSTTITIASGKSLIQVIEDKMVEGGSYVLSWTGTAQARYAINSATPAGSYAASPITIAGQNAGTTMSVEFNTGTLDEVMLAPGTVAAPFERESYLHTLQKCLRYYARLGAGAQAEIEVRGTGTAGDALHSYVPFKVPMRATPTMARVGTFTVSNFNQPTNVGTTLRGFQLTASLIATSAVGGYCLSETTAYFTASAEL